MDSITIDSGTINITAHQSISWSIEFYQRLHELQVQWPAKTLIVIDKKVYSLFETELAYVFATIERKEIMTITARENKKTLSTVHDIVAHAEKMGMHGDGLLVAVGGGIVSDVVGYAASIYRRGVQHIRIPTSLLGQIDAAIGIKNGLNFTNDHKNFLGTFHPARSTIICNEFLKTLNRAQVVEGVAEILKLAVIADRTLFDMVVENKESILGIGEHWNDEVINEILRRSIIGMQQGFVGNYFEHDPRRKVAFAHEIAHTLESRSHYRLSHGQGVALNIAVSSAISHAMKLLSAKDFAAIVKVLRDYGLPIWHDLLGGIDYATLLQAARAQRRGNLHYVLPTSIGECEIVEHIDERAYYRALTILKEGVAND